MSTNNSTCRDCKRLVTTKQRGIECFVCDTWFHIKCQGISLIQYNAAKEPNVAFLHYICSGCRGEVENRKHKLGCNSPVAASTPEGKRNTETGGLNTSLLEQTQDTVVLAAAQESIRVAKTAPVGKCGDISEPMGKVTAPLAKEPIRVAKTKLVGIRDGISVPIGKVSVPLAKNDSWIEAKNVKTRSTNTPREKQPDQKPVAKFREGSLIIMNLPECKDPSLKLRDEHDKGMWASICAGAKLGDIPILSSTRLARTKNSTHINEPRLVRVILARPEDTSKVLLGSQEIVSNVKILPDITWAERNRRREVQLTDYRENVRKRSVILHNVPESSDNEESNAHDKEQWHFLAENMHLTNVVAQGIHRIPRKNVSTAPRLLKVTFVTDEMAAKTIEAFRVHRKTLPGGLVLHPDRSKEERDTRREQYAAKSQELRVVLTDPFNQPKNDMRPISEGSAAQSV